MRVTWIFWPVLAVSNSLAQECPTSGAYYLMSHGQSWHIRLYVPQCCRHHGSAHLIFQGHEFNRAVYKARSLSGTIGVFYLLIHRHFMASTLKTCGCLIFAILRIFSPPAWRSMKQGTHGVSSVRSTNFCFV